MKYVTVLFMGTLLFLGSAFVSDSEEQIQIAEEIWMEIQGYTSWDIIPGGHLMMPGQAPHGKFVTIYANSAAQTALSEDKARMPDGAIYSKDNFDSNKKLNKITLMKKIDSKWFWAVYKPDGSVERAGELNGCIACHVGARKDGVFTWK